jgi:hypothetical protein
VNKIRISKRHRPGILAISRRAAPPHRRDRRHPIAGRTARGDRAGDRYPPRAPVAAHRRRDAAAARRPRPGLGPAASRPPAPARRRGAERAASQARLLTPKNRRTPADPPLAAPAPPWPGSATATSRAARRPTTGRARLQPRTNRSHLIRDLDRSRRLVAATEHPVRCGMSVNPQLSQTAPDRRLSVRYRRTCRSLSVRLVGTISGHTSDRHRCLCPA